MSNPVSPTERLAFSVEEVIAATTLKRTKVYDLINSGAIRSIKVGSRRLIPRAALDEFLGGAA